MINIVSTKNNFRFALCLNLIYNFVQYVVFCGAVY